MVREDTDQVGEVAALRRSVVLIDEFSERTGWVLDRVNRFLTEAAKPITEDVGTGAGEAGGENMGLLHTGTTDGVWYSRQTATRAICIPFREKRRAAYSRASVTRVGM